MKLLIYVTSSVLGLSFVAADCIDIYGKTITQNAHFIPGPDVCQLCVCDNTSPKWCKRILCSPPMNCKSFVMGTSCCDYSCLDNSLPNNELRDEIDRRFLITIATAFLILTALLIVIHKLRTRTIPGGRLQSRPLTEDRRTIGFITGSLGYLNLPPNVHHLNHFEDHPIVHFPIYKPNGYYSRGEAPPPYDEAIAEARLSSYAQYEMITNERNMIHLNHQRSRRNLIPYGPPRIIDANGNCVSEPRPGENGVFVNDTTISDNCGSLPQHRTIPLPLCGNSDQINNRHAAENILLNGGANNRLYSVGLHKSNEPDYYRIRANSTNQGRPNAGKRPNTCPPQFHLAVTSLNEVAIPPSNHRALPLSASLSSPLPSTSDHQGQFSEIILGPTSSSAANLPSLSSENRTPAQIPTQEPAFIPTPSTFKRHHHHHHHHHKTCKKTPQIPIVMDVCKTTHASVASSNDRRGSKNSNSKEPVLSSGPSSGGNNSCTNKETKEESHDECAAVEDYYAECENCNLNVGGDGDVSDDYFSMQETMTLQRKLHEVSVAQTMDNKVSLTLPSNSKSRRCSSKSRKCGAWNTKESPFKATLDYVSSEGESDEEKVDGTGKKVEDMSRNENQEFSVVEEKNSK